MLTDHQCQSGRFSSAMHCDYHEMFYDGSYRIHFKCTPHKGGAPKNHVVQILMGMSVLARTGLVGSATLFFGMRQQPGRDGSFRGNLLSFRVRMCLDCTWTYTYNLWTSWEMVGDYRGAIKNTYGPQRFQRLGRVQRLQR